MDFKDEIKQQVFHLRKVGETGNLHVVPITNVKCAIPCGSGRCVCKPTVGKQHTVVNDKGKQRAMDEQRFALELLNGWLNEYDK